MTYNLEQRASESGSMSYGERRIAKVLDRYGVPYEYERPLLVLDQAKPRIWYPYVEREIM